MDHNKIIIKTATAFFKNHGISRKGQSRTFLDDHCWFTTIIEFQPHRWEKGTFLNVGVNFHWYEKDYFSFDVGSRETPFIEFNDEEKFQSEIEDLCKLALKKVVEYREAMKTLKSAREKICDYEFSSDTLWGNYHKGTVSALVGDINTMEKYYLKLLDFEHNVEWANELKERTKLLLKHSSDLGKFKSEIEKIIFKTRQLKKLPECQFNF
jgi:hypothetical protein